MLPRPDFSPAMLRVFLVARQHAREGFERRPVLARTDLVGELVGITGLPESTVRKAFAGDCRDDGARAALWAAIGHAPGAEALMRDGVPTRV